MNIGVVRRHSAARIHAYNDRLRMQPLALANALKDWWMALIRICTEDEETIGVISVGVATRRLVLTVSGDVAACGRGHTQTRIAIHIVRADSSLEQLVGCVALFGGRRQSRHHSNTKPQTRNKRPKYTNRTLSRIKPHPPHPPSHALIEI